MEEIIAGIVKAFINSGPIGLLALILMAAVLGLVKWLRSVYSALAAIQERRVAERDAVVTALKSAADGLEEVARLTPEVTEALRVLNQIKEMICPDPAPRKRR